ncbi:poly-gamma-glutamate biosynthesis protein [bacterium]|nr:poly-gamma-glutamate biosynthesis protein [bacterium]
MAAAAPVTLFLGGDVMIGRGIDQVFEHSVDATLHEPYVRSARTYVALAEEANGPVPEPVAPAYPWHDALGILDARRPDVRIVNLETAVSAGGEPWPGKGIHYRVHPDNVACLTAARIDCCVLANNHVLDWGRTEVPTTLEALRGAGLATAGAGRDLAEAEAPAILPLPGSGRVLVFAVGHGSSGIPAEWSAGPGRAGLSLLPALDPDAAVRLGARIDAERRPGDLVVVSVHWGDNWGWAIPDEQTAFARTLIDSAGVDVVYGHSSHHPRAIEVHHDRPILYGCGDLLNDYEGIGGHREYRGELALMYFVELERRSGALRALTMMPVRIARLRLNRAGQDDAAWLARTLDRECKRFGGAVELQPDRTLRLRW